MTSQPRSGDIPLGENAAAPRLIHIFEIDAIPSAHALGYLDVAAPRLIKTLGH